MLVLFSPIFVADSKIIFRFVPSSFKFIISINTWQLKCSLISHIIDRTDAWGFAFLKIAFNVWCDIFYQRGKRS